MSCSLAAEFDDLTSAFRAGEGFGWHRHDERFWHGSDALTRVALPDELISAILDGLGPVAEALTEGGTVLDVGCGFGTPPRSPWRAGWRAPGCSASTTTTRRSRPRAGPPRPPTCPSGSGSSTDLPGAGFALVTFYSLHDLGGPVGALMQAKDVLAPQGVVLLVEPLAADRVEDNLTPPGRMFFAVSTLICTPNAVSQIADAGRTQPLGSQAGEALLRSTATAAGFTHIRRVPVAAPLNLVLELRP